MHVLPAESNGPAGSAAVAITTGVMTRLLIALVVAEMTCSLESGMIYAALSALYKQYGDPIGVGWLLTAFTLTSAASAAVAGRLGDLFGRRRVMLVMLGLALAGSMLSALTKSLPLVAVGRAIQGVSMAILPLGFGILRETLPPKNLGFGISVIGSTYTVGGGLGVVFGGIIVDHFNWQAIFIVSALLAFASLVLVLAFVPKSARPPAQGGIDWIGALLFAPAVAMVLYGLSEGLGRSWTISLVVILIGGLCLFAFWLIHELRHANPLIDVRQLGRREVGFANLAFAAISMGPLLGPVLLLPLLQQPVWTGIGFGVSATLAGFIKLPANGAATIGALVCGALTRRVNVRSIMIVAAVGSALGWFGIVMNHHDFWVVVLLITVLIVPTGSILLVMTPQVIIQAVPDERTSEATGLSQVVRAFSKAIGTQVIALSFASAMVSAPGGGAYPAQSAYVLAFMICGGLSVVCLGFILLLPANLQSVGQANA